MCVLVWLKASSPLYKMANSVKITFDCIIKSASFMEAKLLELLLKSLSRLSLSLRKLDFFSRACKDFLHTVNVTHK